jgi:uncharacterized protein
MWDSEPDLEALRRFHGMLSTDPVAALAGLKELAGRGSVSSMVYIAHAYRHGTGTGVDLFQSNEWYRRAMDAGSPLASYELARNYMNAKDYDRVIEMWSLGAENRYPPSMHMLGVSYARGWRVPKNLNKARELLEGAADQGHLYAKAKLRCLLMRGGFGFRERLRGIRLALSIPKDLVAICRDPHSERLR